MGPVFHGDTLYTESKVVDARASNSRPDRGIVTVDTRGWNQRGETVVTCRRTVRVPRRPAKEAFVVDEIVKLRSWA